MYKPSFPKAPAPWSDQRNVLLSRFPLPLQGQKVDLHLLPRRQRKKPLAVNLGARTYRNPRVEKLETCKWQEILEERSKYLETKLESGSTQFSIQSSFFGGVANKFWAAHRCEDFFQTSSNHSANEFREIFKTRDSAKQPMITVWCYPSSFYPSSNLEPSAQ